MDSVVRSSSPQVAAVNRQISVVALLLLSGQLGSWLSAAEIVVNHIHSVRPDLQVFHMSYDFPRPLPIGTPLQVNQAALTFSSLQHALSWPNYTYLDYYGLTQIEYGIPSLGLPPGDPSLPRIDQPGPAAAFRDNIHLTDDAYLLFAERSFAAYRPLLVPEPSTPAALLILAGGAIGLRRKRCSSTRVDP